MSHVVTSYQWAWRAGSGPEETIEILNWLGEMSEKGWEVKTCAVTVAPSTIQAGGRNVEAWVQTIIAFVQRPDATADAAVSWEYPE